MMRLLGGFAALSLISGALTALLPEGSLRRTAAMAIGLMMLIYWASGLEEMAKALPEALLLQPEAALSSTGLSLPAIEAALTQEESP